MTPERWARIKGVFVSALDLDEEGRAAFLVEACAGDPDLLARVRELLASDARAETFLEGSPLAQFTEAEMTTVIGRQVGPYEIVREIGRGGMGTVFLARRNDGQFQKQVAIKLITNEIESDAARRRVRRERQILAQVDHPNIARLLDAGSTGDGVPYLIMDYVDGVPIDRYCDAHSLDTASRLRLFLGVCSAVQYAHQYEITHRDIKPANILVTAEGIPKLLDFGIARMLQPESSTRSEETGTFAPQPMTPAYASPEQVRGEPVTAASDIYSLGVVLFELLTCRRPYNLEGCTWNQVERIICEEEPKKPSAMPGRGDLAGGLDQVVLRALHKEPQRRHKSVADLSQDILRYLEGREVSTSLSTLTDRSTRFLRRYRLPLCAAAVVALVIIGLRFRPDQPTKPGGADALAARTIAVLPLQDVSAEPRLEHFADTMTDSLIGTLARIRSLRVIARDSVMLYKGKRKPAAQTVRELNAGTLVDGSVFRSGDQVRLNLRLTAGAKDQVLWSHTYDGDVRDVPGLQGKAARAIASELRIQLTAEEDARLSPTHPVNRKSYEAYLKGRYFWYKYTEEGFQKGAQYFKDAIELDPVNAPGWAGLADAYYQMSSVYLDPREAMPKAKGAALKALAIDEDLAEAHATLAQVQAQYEWNWKAAETGFRRAVALNPSYPHGHLYYSIFLSEQGRLDEAIAQAAEAERLDPLTALMPTNLAYVSYLARRYDQALAHLRQALELGPGATVVHYGLGLVYEQQSKFDEAIAEFSKAVQATPKDASHRERAFLGHAYAVAGRKDEARRVLAELRQLASRRHVDPYNFAVVHAGLRETDSAFEWLEKAYQARSEDLLMLKVDPRLDSLRSDRRYSDLVRRLGLPP